MSGGQRTNDIRVTEGSWNCCPVDPKVVFSACLRHRAPAVILVHNHPSGDPDPSPEDVAITRKLLFACKAVGITVHEHLVIGDNRYFSFADQGYIRQYNQEFESIMI